MSRINITLGTAGHIDHGKTSLVKCLTGCETDRLREEKERGMSIELGFAPCTLADLEVGIVDVPGHENFIKTMVAGATGIDGVIFLVAADDGVMPQTREHLDILTLLGIQHGVIALTKIDMVTPERVEAARDEVRDFLSGTFLQDCPICPVSSITGEGFDGFYGCLTDMVKSIHPKSVDGIFRLPVERAFSVRGFGTVISGIPAAGSAKVGDEVILLPVGRKSRVKSAQVYGKSADVVCSGQCAALNLPQIDYQLVERGQVLTMGDYFTPGRWFLLSLKTLPLESLRLKNGAQVKFHTGTAETAATLYLLGEEEIAAGAGAMAQIRTEHPIVAGPRDRFILRMLSPVRTIGGGFVVRSLAERLKRTKADVIDDAAACARAVFNDADFVEYFLRTSPASAPRVKDLSYETKILPDAVQSILEQLKQSGKAVELAAGLYIHSAVFDAIQKDLLSRVGQYHNDNPAAPGIEPEKLPDLCGLQKTVFDAVIGLLMQQKKLVLRKDRIALPDFVEILTSAQSGLLGRIESAFKDNMFAPPSVEELAARLKTDAGRLNTSIKILCDQKILFRVEQGMYFHAAAIEEAKRRIAEHIRAEDQGRLESVDFKYLVDTTRKFALPLLDYMDKIGFTRRVGNTRYMKK